MKKITIRRNKAAKTTNKIRSQIKKVPEVIGEGSRIFFISNMAVDEGFYYWIYRYEATPYKIQETYYDKNIDLPVLLREYDYLYLKDFDESFLNKYSQFFDKRVDSDSYYKIIKDKNRIRLEKLNQEEKEKRNDYCNRRP